MIVVRMLRNSWKLIVTLVGAIGIIGVLWVTMNSIATADDVKKAKTEMYLAINEVREDGNKSTKILNERIEFNADVQRLKTLDDISAQLEMIILDNPRNIKAKEQKAKVDLEREVILNRITKTK